jgi:HK97 gp10 family phage protein
MVGKVIVSIRGAKELEALLKGLGPRVAARVSDKAIRAGAKVVADEARRLVPVKTGALKKSIAVVQAPGKRQSERAMVLGFRRPAGRRAHFTEFGTVKSAARPFLRPAFDAKYNEAVDAIGKVLGDGIDKEAAALDKKSPLRIKT